MTRCAGDDQQQRVPSASSELKCVMDRRDRGEDMTRTQSPSAADELADSIDCTAAESLIADCSCTWRERAPGLQRRAATIQDAAGWRQLYGARPPERKGEKRAAAARSQ